MLGLFAFILVFSVMPVPIAKAATAPYFSITLIAPTSNPVRRQWAQIIQNSFTSANIQANLVYESFAQWLDLLLGNTTCGAAGAPAPLAVEGPGAQNCPALGFSNGGWDAGFVGEGGGTVLPDFGTRNVVLYRGASAATSHRPVATGTGGTTAPTIHWRQTMARTSTHRQGSPTLSRWSRSLLTKGRA